MFAYKGEYLFPPRPEAAFPPDSLSMYESNGYVCQAKKNGTCTLLVMTPSEIIAYDRHGSRQKMWKGPNKDMTSGLRERLPIGYSAIVGETLHSKVPGIRDVFYIFDIVAVQGQLLLGKTFRDRQKIIRDVFKGGKDYQTHRDIGGGIWVAKNFIAGFSALYSKIIVNPEDEGLVVKHPDARLANMFKEGMNSSWQAKCRKPTKNYSF